MGAPEPNRRWAELRRAAESRLRTGGVDSHVVGRDQAQLIHELQVLQVELEMQNEELMAAHAETARSFVRYQRLSDLAPVACVSVDRSGRVQDSNLRAAILFHIAHSELSGQPLQKFMPQHSADIFHRHLRSVFARSARQTCNLALERRVANSSSFPVRIESIAVPDEGGKRMLCQSVLINLSEVHEPQEGLEGLMGQGTSGASATAAETAAGPIAGSDAEADIGSLHTVPERLDALREQRDFAERQVETVPAILLVLDLDGCIVRFNRCFEDITGYRLKEVRGDDWIETFVPEGDREQVRAAFARTLRGEITSATIHPIRTRRGSNTEIEWHHTLLRDARAIACGSLSIGLDVTRRRQLEASQRVAAVGAFAAGVARAIDDPINQLVNCALLLLDGNPLRDGCKILLEESGKISRVVKHLQQFARGDRAPQPTSLAEVVSHTVAMQEENLDRHGIRLEVEVPADLPPVVAHPQQLQQVLLNLLHNAKDALQSTRSGSRLVTIQAFVKGGAWVSCHVRDNGPGIPPDLAPSIFEPFVTTNRAQGGTGLGLFVSRSIIESFGGRLTFQSVPGEFAEFTFELPQAGSAQG